MRKQKPVLRSHLGSWSHAINTSPCLANLFAESEQNDRAEQVYGGRNGRSALSHDGLFAKEQRKNNAAVQKKVYNMQTT